MASNPSNTGSTSVSIRRSAYASSRVSAFDEQEAGPTVLELFIQELLATGLPGPAVLAGSAEYLGQGAQFFVRKQLWMSNRNGLVQQLPVAVKQPKFNFNPNAKLNMADTETRQHIRSAYLEIVALTHPTLRHHSSIARLLAWSYDIHRYHRPFTLIMELADFTLSAYLKDAAIEENPGLMIGFCEEIAAGLDALHACDFVHGDLKPDNVLLYRQDGRIVAKLADFGLCMTETASTGSSRKKAVGTPGWQAPEVEKGTWCDVHELLKADSYSYGLVIWSILLCGGRVPLYSEGISRQRLALKAFEQSACDLGFDSQSQVVRTIESLLELLPANRPTTVGYLLQAPKDESISENMLSRKPRALSQAALGVEKQCHGFNGLSSRCRTYEWELLYVDDWMSSSLYAQFLNHRKLSKALLFNMFLAFTLTTTDNAPSRSPALGFLCASAQQGFEPALAAVPTAFRHYGVIMPTAVQENLTDWISRAVGSGASIAQNELRHA